MSDSLLGGMSPQVVTETLYILCTQRVPAFVPTEVLLITTTRGRDEAIEHLLSEDGEFHAFTDDYGLSGQINFGIDHLLPLVDDKGSPLHDVRSVEDNISAADAITEKIRQLTSDKNCALHVSISGGRNTLGFYLGYALSMFGRPQDRLSHVLVPAEFECNPAFFYPPPQPEMIRSRRGNPISTHQAEITLAEIPFVSLRHGLPDALLNGRASYSQTVAAIELALAPPRLRINFQKQEILCGDQAVDMPPQLFAFYAWLAEQRLTDTVNGGQILWRDAGLATSFLNIYRRVVGEMAHDYEMTCNSLAEGFSSDFINEKKSRINYWLKDCLGSAVSAPYLITSSGKRPRTRQGLQIDPRQIQISA